MENFQKEKTIETARSMYELALGDELTFIISCKGLNEILQLAWKRLYLRVIFLSAFYSVFKLNKKTPTVKMSRCHKGTDVMK